MNFDLKYSLAGDNFPDVFIASIQVRSEMTSLPFY